MLTISKRVFSQSTSARRAYSRAAIEQPHLLFRIHGALGFAEFGRRARLHFHERQCRAVPRDDVDLARPGPRPIIPCNDRAPVSAQIAMRVILTHPPMVVVERAAPQRVRRPVKESDHVALQNSRRQCGIDGLTLSDANGAANDVSTALS